MAVAIALKDLGGDKRVAFDTISDRIRNTTKLEIRNEIAGETIFKMGNSAAVGFEFVAKKNSIVSFALRNAMDSQNRLLFKAGDRSKLLKLPPDPDPANIAALASNGVAFREIDRRDHSHAIRSAFDDIPSDKGNATWMKEFSNSYGRFNLDLTSLHFTVPRTDAEPNAKDPAKCSVHIDRAGFTCDVGHGPGMTPEIGEHILNELIVGDFGRTVFGDAFADHFGFVVPSAYNKYRNAAGAALTFRPASNVAVEIYATYEGVFQEKLVFIDTGKFKGAPTNFGFNVSGTW